MKKVFWQEEVRNTEGVVIIRQGWYVCGKNNKLKRVEMDLESVDAYVKAAHNFDLLVPEVGLSPEQIRRAVKNNEYLNPLQVLSEPLPEDRSYLVLDCCKLRHLLGSWGEERIRSFKDYRDFTLRVLPVVSYMVSPWVWRPLNPIEQNILIRHLWENYKNSL